MAVSGLYTYSISACCHVLFGIMVVLDQFGGKLIQSLEKSITKTLSQFVNPSKSETLATKNVAPSSR